ncbi:MAG: ribbon-helix-helix protein, CopG family [Proteobacteria bacterium]|jgi:hypothetical protein|nr:ribbon-helix-helix protein, CopG family [Pseudomonadota bacterium]
MAQNVMSISLPLEMQELLDVSAKKMGWNKSELLRKLITKGLDLVVVDGEEIPVILKIPNELRGQPEVLRKWLYQKSDAITTKLSQK